MKTPAWIKSRGMLAPLICTGVLFSSPACANSVKPCGDQDSKGWTLRSSYPVKETLDRLTYYLRHEPGVRIFYRVNQQQIANQNGGKVSEVESMAFEKQQLATKLLSANIAAAASLPIQATSWKDDKGQVWISVSDICEINRKYDLQGADGAVEAVNNLLSGWLEKVVAEDGVIGR